MSSSQRPLSATLSQLLIAYTLEFDAALTAAFNESRKGAPPSLAMWANVLRFVGDDGVAVQKLGALSGIAKPTIKTMIACLQRHGWVCLDDEGNVRLTEGGALAAHLYARAHQTVLARWEGTLGAREFAALQSALEFAADRLGSEFPHYPMPAPHRGAYPRGE